MLYACFSYQHAQLDFLAKPTGAGEGNRTLVISLEGFSSTIELHPRDHFNSIISLLPLQYSYFYFFPKWWRGLDSNQRTRKRADLQSAAINHSATSPQGTPDYSKAPSECQLWKSISSKYFLVFFNFPPHYRRARPESGKSVKNTSPAKARDNIRNASRVQLLKIHRGSGCNPATADRRRGGTPDAIANP